VGDPSASCQSMCKIAWQYSQLGDWRTALKILIEAKKSYTLPSSSTIWHKITLQILQNWAFHRGHLRVAEQLSQLYDAVCSCDPTDIHARIDSKFRHALIHLHKKNYITATHELNHLIEYCINHGLEIYTISLRLSLAEVYHLAGCYTEAVPFVLACLTLSEQYHMDSLNALAKIQLAELQLNMNDSPFKVADLVKSILPLVLQHCDIEAVAKARLVLGKCLIAQESDLQGAIELIESAAQGMESIEYYSKLEDIYYLLTRIYHHMDNKTKRNFYANKFRQIQSSLCEAENFWADSYFTLDLSYLLSSTR